MPMKFPRHWPGGPMEWLEGRTLYVSIPFTWDLPEVRYELNASSLLWDRAVVGGPAVRLMPGYFDILKPYVTEGGDLPGVLQRVNPMATRTTLGCSRRCPFCAVRQIEGRLVELGDWPDLPILVDNNLLATSSGHFDRVMDRLERWEGVDFNQGIDSRLLTPTHAHRIGRLPRPYTVRLALDHDGYRDAWEQAYVLLRRAGVPNRFIRSYCLIGWKDTPTEAWKRCEWVEAHGAMPLPMWFHELTTMQRNVVTEAQEQLGWSGEERKRIMRWFYWRNGQRPALLGPRPRKCGIPGRIRPKLNGGGRS